MEEERLLRPTWLPPIPMHWYTKYTRASLVHLLILRRPRNAVGFVCRPGYHIFTMDVQIHYVLAAHTSLASFSTKCCCAPFKHACFISSRLVGGKTTQA